MRADLLRLIARAVLFVDLLSQRLWDGSAQVFLDEAAALSAPPATEPFASFGVRPPVPVTLAVGRRVRWSGDVWAIEVIGGGQVWLRNVRDETRDLVSVSIGQAERLAHEGKFEGLEVDLIADIQAAALAEWNSAAPKDRASAQRRLHAIQSILVGGRLPVQRRRTLQRWRDDYQAAERLKGNGLLGLLPHWSHRGRPLPAPIVKIIEEVVAEVYMTPVGKSFKATYGAIAPRVAAASLPVPHPKTVRRYMSRRRANDVTLARSGSAVAYQTEPFIFHLEYDSPVHGGWPFHIAHLDHTLGDIELVSSRTGENLGRPWVSLLQDAFSRRCLALWVTFDPPSYRSAMMILRLCVANHGRLPQVLVVDQGAEFGSTYFEQVLGWNRVQKRERPARQPRFGATIERLFGVTTQQLIHNLPGNTKLTRNIRQMTPEVDPRRHAALDLMSFHEALANYLAEGYEHEIHRSLRATPAAMFEQGVARSGNRPTAHIGYTPDFVISLLPTTDTGKATVDPNQGIVVRYLSYWCDAFARPGVARTQVEVRYDPSDLRYCLAYVNGQWERCVPTSIPGGWPRSERELWAVTTEIRAEFKQQDRRFRVSAETLSQHLDRADVAAKAAAQRRRDVEAAALIESLGVGVPLLGDGAMDGDGSVMADANMVVPGVDADVVLGTEGHRPSAEQRDLEWRRLGLPERSMPY